MDTPKLISGLLYIVTTLIEGLLALRIVLKLLGASTIAPFVRWLYETTNPLLNPFEGMFPSSGLSRFLTIEFSAIIALVVYAFLGYLAVNAVEYFSFEPKPKKEK